MVDTYKQAADIRAARGDEPDEARERIMQLEADLEAADDEARKLREIICDAWRKDALSDEERQVVELIAACEALIAYWDRVGPLSFQLEKADDYIRMMRLAVEKARGPDGD